MEDKEKFLRFVRSLPVLEPLSGATSKALEPDELANTDYLEIGLDDDGRRFTLKAVAMYKGAATGHQASFNARAAWYKRIPEVHASKHKVDVYFAAATDFTALVISHQWPPERLIFKSAAAQTIYEFLLMRFLAQTQNAVIGADFKVNGNVPEMPEDFVEHPDPAMRLAPYQKVGFRMSIMQECFMLLMQQGTGKTPISIARINYEARRARLGKDGKIARMYRVLIICPRQARLNWSNEIERFTVSQGKITILRGGQHRRVRGIIDAVTDDPECEFSACICGFETVDNTWEFIGTVPWDLVIIDEGHKIRNQASQRSQACRRLRETTLRRMELTGTPIVNQVFDMWAQWEFLADGMSGFLVYKNFRGFYGKFERQGGKGGGVERLLAMKNLPLVQERLARTSFSITKKEAGLNLPEKRYDVYEVQMSPKQREYYVQISKQLALQIQQDLKNKEMTANNILTRMLRLAQITSGHVKWDAQFNDDGEEIEGGRIEQISAENPKVEALIEMLKDMEDDNPECKTLVWACWREDIRVICERLKAEGIPYLEYHGGISDAKRAEAVAAFNKDPKYKVFVLNQKAAAEALNLLGYDYETMTKEDATTYTGLEVYFSQNWSPDERGQSEDRAHRRGTRGDVLIRDLMVPGTIDEEIRTRVYHKRDTAATIQDVKDILARLTAAEVEEDE